ncbi:ATP-dependent DNA helicase RecG [Ligilactobacillus salivarius]|uniref:ATP-dependent DNA helicase RecG n=1 Tax=Ligilactobacillus salivarius TaxID=1624 RepID=UPI00195A8AF0|nr:ATP-dependent DNA helicase RecG [Ligilactobacillus salivarius]MBM6707182.1 ATP-dependent DNA helicase RecG [Ligilactobacillus salivarius]
MLVNLGDSVGVLRGVGPKKIQALNKLGVNTIEDLLTFYPFRYNDIAVKNLEEINSQEKVTLKGIVASEPVLVRFGRKKSRLNFKLLINHDVIGVTFFNQPWISKQVTTGQELAVYGKYDALRQSLSGIKIISRKTNDFVGVYRSSKDIKESVVKQLVKQAYEEYNSYIRDVVPESIRIKYHLENRKQMIHDMHFPSTKKEADSARRSAIFDEFFSFEAGLQLLKRDNHKNMGLRIKYNNEKLKEFIKGLPFELTKAQKRVVNEICADMLSPNHMNRLLQGDVGSGKTIIAAIAMYATVTAGFQAVLMAPTEILAQQHAEKLANLFEQYGISVALMTSSSLSRVKVKRELLKHLKNGDIDIVIGTHAVIQDNIEFHNLGLAITDEQHRFGVNQRRILRKKGVNPEILAMTATPIPRTLAITTYGEMDVSIIDELPKGRQPVKTSWVKKKQVKNVFEFVKRQLELGTQAYIISPLVEESELLDLQNAEEVFEKAKEYFGSEKVALLHGKMDANEKEQAMQAFKNKEVSILVSTTVIEVGVDVPNATVMIILDADRFGLAQLHQLRGRVGRGSKESYCILVADPKSEYGKERMKIMTGTNDGFLISQKDLELRGPGEVLGKKQSGLPEFKVGDPVVNLNILQVVQEEAHNVVFSPNFKTKEENFELIKYLNRQFAQEEIID